MRRVRGIRPHAMVPVRRHIQYVTSDTSRAGEVGSDYAKTTSRDLKPGLLSSVLCLEIMTLVLNFGSTLIQTLLSLGSIIPINVTSLALMLPAGSDGNESTYNAGDTGLIPVKIPEEEKNQPSNFAR